MGPVVISEHQENEAFVSTNADCMNALNLARGGFNEATFYKFGLRVGLRNLMTNGCALGVKKTVGKLSQPINSFTRFCEYDFMLRSFVSYRQSMKQLRRMQVLDVGSPKCFSFFLASHFDIRLLATDINHLALQEYEIMWRANRSDATGSLIFSLEDARNLSHRDSSFDVVYSMSVLEHITGEAGVTRALREMSRVLRPGGLLLLSVPFGPHYVDQYRTGLAEAARRTQDEQKHFFQRIYDEKEFREQVLEAIPEVKIVRLLTAGRRSSALLNIYRHLGENVRGILGFLNPILSVYVNHVSDGMAQSYLSSYSPEFSLRDICADVMLCAVKSA